MNAKKELFTELLCVAWFILCCCVFTMCIVMTISGIKDTIQQEERDQARQHYKESIMKHSRYYNR